MEQKYLTAFVEFQYATLQERILFNNLSEFFIHDPYLESILYHIYLCHQKGYQPTTTQLMIELNIDYQKMKKLIDYAKDIGYLEEEIDPKDRRVRRYALTETSLQGMQIHLYRMGLSLIDLFMKIVPPDLKKEMQILMESNFTSQYTDIPAYGKGDTQTVETIMGYMGINDGFNGD